MRISGEQGRRRGKREANAKRELRARGSSHATRASRSPRFRPCSPDIRKKSRLFCRLNATSKSINCGIFQFDASQSNNRLIQPNIRLKFGS